MISRRDTLKWGLGGLALSGSGFAGASEPSSALPPAISQLKNQRHRMVPISVDERHTRVARAQELMAQHHIDAMILAEGTSLKYFTGVSWWGSERLFVFVLPRVGQPFVVCPAFEEGRAREQLEKGLNLVDIEVRTWQEDESPYEQCAHGLKTRQLHHQRIGLEENVRFVFSSNIQKALPHATFVSATPITAGCRMHKSPAEIALMRLASEVTVAAYQATFESIRPDMTQQAISELSRLAHAQLGFEGAADLVLIDESSAFPHGSVKPTPIREGSLVLFDGGCTIDGYHSDITRTFVLGTPSAHMQEVFAVVHAAQQAALKTAGPMVACGEVDRAARAVITAAGFGPDYKTFTHRLGHGIGMDGHEWPYLVRHNDFLLSPGITTSNEPGIYLKGEFGIRLEDEMLITEHGAELLTGPAVSLTEPCGTQIIRASVT
jgi:Xaa-Pro dipeptidase